MDKNNVLNSVMKVGIRLQKAVEAKEGFALVLADEMQDILTVLHKENPVAPYEHTNFGYANNNTTTYYCGICHAEIGYKNKYCWKDECRQKVKWDN